ncbi:unnamed protein product, partial [Scytosiphon promiscuus]
MHLCLLCCVGYFQQASTSLVPSLWTSQSHHMSVLTSIRDCFSRVFDVWLCPIGPFLSTRKSRNNSESVRNFEAFRILRCSEFRKRPLISILNPWPKKTEGFTFGVS